MLLRKGKIMVEAINESFGMTFHIEEIPKIKGLPMYMTLSRSFYRVSDDANQFLLIKVPNDDKFGIITLAKQKAIYEEKSNLPVAYWFDGLSRYQRDSFIKHKIPFVADNTQMYLPFLGVAIQNTFRKKKEVSINKMMPITQCLFLYLLYACDGKSVIKKDAAEFLNVTKTSITRASDQLEKMGLINQKISGKECYIRTVDSGYDLFLKAEKYLINPIQTTLTTEKKDFQNEAVIAGETALANYSMLNPPKVGSLAINKALYKKYKPEQIDERWEDKKILVKLELWKYDPRLFSKNGIADPISLYMTMKTTKDERIEEALEKMMEGINGRRN